MQIIEYFDSDRQDHWRACIQDSDWGAGKYLYRLLAEGTLKELVGEKTRLLLLTDGEELVSYCTLAEKDDIQPTELTPWIGWVYTYPAYRGHRYMGQLLSYAEELAAAEGQEQIFISTNHDGLYEKYGYEFYQIMKDVHGEDSRVYRKNIREKRRKQMDYNYHTHTSRCGHATDNAEDYVLVAIENGITDMGFSEHVPYCLPNGTESGYRVPVAQAVEYCEEIKGLAEKYKDRIRIRVGFEAEYYPGHFEELLEQVKGYGAEYLIMGEHFIEPELEGVPHMNTATEDVELLKRYVDTVIEGMKTGRFTYVAHPDMMKFVGEKFVYQQEMRRLCIASRELDIPVEINFLGIRTQRNYPNEAFWEVAGEEQAPVTFGYDAHGAQKAYDGESEAVALQMVEKYHLNYIGAAKIRSLV